MRRVSGSVRKSPVPGGGRHGRTSRLLALIVTNFVVFWLPWNVLSLVVEFDRLAVPTDLFRLWNSVAVVVIIVPCGGGGGDGVMLAMW